MGRYPSCYGAATDALELIWNTLPQIINTYIIYINSYCGIYSYIVGSSHVGPTNVGYLFVLSRCFLILFTDVNGRLKQGLFMFFCLPHCWWNISCVHQLRWLVFRIFNSCFFTSQVVWNFFHQQGQDNLDIFVLCVFSSIVYTIYTHTADGIPQATAIKPR